MPTAPEQPDLLHSRQLAILEPHGKFSFLTRDGGGGEPRGEPEKHTA